MYYSTYSKILVGYWNTFKRPYYYCNYSIWWISIEFYWSSLDRVITIIVRSFKSVSIFYRYFQISKVICVAPCDLLITTAICSRKIWISTSVEIYSADILVEVLRYQVIKFIPTMSQEHDQDSPMTYWSIIEYIGLISANHLSIIFQYRIAEQEYQTISTKHQETQAGTLLSLLM